MISPGYKCLPQQKFGGGAYRLETIRYCDMMDIKQWRNDQIKILRQPQPLTDEQQELYYKNIVLPSLAHPQPAQILFSYIHNNLCIGYGGFVHIDWISRRAEVSFLLKTELIMDAFQYDILFRTYLKLLKEIAFHHLQFHRLYTETFDIKERKQHISILESCGFSYEGRLKEHIFIDGIYVDAIIHGCISK